jgi:2-iminoacetate synthase
VARFSEFFKERQSRLETLTAISEPVRPVEAILAAAEQGMRLQVEDVASLAVWACEPAHRAEFHAAARRIRNRFAPKTTGFVIPVYLTSYCQNECLYCGYRRSNPIAERIRLALEDFAKELDLITSWGHRQIELVLSDDPQFGPEVLTPYLELTRQKLERVGGGIVGLCSPVYRQEDYVRLRAAGLDWVVEWQETYHQPHFDRWHFPGSQKRNFEFRLDLWDRVIPAGITKIALGVLLGLYDWRYDVLAVVEHGNYLRETYGLEPYALGIPRLKPARGVLASQKPSRFTVSDEDYRLVVSLYHLAFPSSRLFFNTRENYEFNLSMLAAGDLFTVDCETLPGGYLRPRLPGQFSTHHYPPRREVVSAIRRQGLCPEHLAKESDSPPETIPVPVPTLDQKRWIDEHAQIRLRLDDWQMLQMWLAIQREGGLPERQAAGAALRMVLYFFNTFVIQHCRSEETGLFPTLIHRDEEAQQVQQLRQHHERLSVDLDKFERQLISFGLSGDPSVLLTLGDRIIAESREHLAAEEELVKNRSAAPLGDSAQDTQTAWR